MFIVAGVLDQKKFLLWLIVVSWFWGNRCKAEAMIGGRMCCNGIWL